jgi:hypothetical protein
MHLKGRRVSSLPGVDMPAGSNPNTTGLLVSFPSEDARKVIFIHQVSFPTKLPILFRGGPDILLLIFGENQLCAPASFTTTPLPLPAGAAMDRLRNAKHISSVVPLHVLLQMHLKLPVRIGCARYTGESISATARAELFVHILGRRKAGMAAFDERLQV